RDHGAGGVDHVVDEDAVSPVDLAHDAAGLDGAARARALLVDGGQVGIEVTGEAFGHLHATGVGRDNDNVAGRVRLEVLDEHRNRLRLHDEDVGAANGVTGTTVDLAVGEVVDVGLAQLHAEVAGDVLR